MSIREAHLLAIVAAVLSLLGCQKRTPAIDEVRSIDSVLPETNLDLRSIARPIEREPDYQSSPLYTLLVFGKTAEHQSWLVVDGTAVYFDRNGNGDLAEVDEKILLDVNSSAKVDLSPGEYKGMNIFQLGELAGYRFELHVLVLNEEFVPEKNESEWLTQHREERLRLGWVAASLFRYPAGGGAQIPVKLCPNPHDAQINHMDGPLTFRLKSPARQELLRGRKVIFDVHVGTPGVPPRHSRYTAFANLATSEVPDDIHPVAAFEFPGRASDKVRILKVSLNRRC